MLSCTTIYALALVPALGIGDQDNVTVVLCQDIWYCTQITNGNQPQNIVSHLVPDQAIVL